MDADDDLEPEDDLPPEIDISELEGFKDEFWNLGQVVAWVNTRSPYVVDAYSDSTPTLAQRNNSIHPGFPEFAEEFDARCAERFGYVQFVSPFANDELLYLSILRAFQTGQLEASGQRNDGSRESISEIEWAALVIGRALTGEIAVKQFNQSTAAWHDVRVRRSSILCAYEGPNAPVNRQMIAEGHRNPAKHPKQGELEAAYRRRIEEFRGKSPPSRADDGNWIKSTFGIPKSRARQLRKSLAPPEWTDRGRRKNKTGKR
jgi:hypothetical protein